MESGTTEVSRHDETGSSGTPIEIKVKTMDSQTYSLRVDKQMPVPALKERIASVTGVVTEHQRLICRGKVLKDDQLLSAYHVEDGHTLHLVVREPASSSSGNLPADPGFDRPSSGARGQFYQVAPGIVIETFNMPGGSGQGERVLPDIGRILSAVLGSIGVPNPGNGSEGTSVRDQGSEGHAGTPAMSGTTDTPQTQPEQSGMRGQSDRSRLNNAFGIPAAVSFGSLQAPVVPDALTTLSQYLRHMSQEFINNGRGNENNNGVSASRVNEGGSSSSVQSESAQQGLPSPASLAEILSSTRQTLNQQIEECLLQLATQLRNQTNMTDPAARVIAQSSALRTGVLLQNLGAYLLELGRTVTTLRLGRSPSEAVVNAGPAVFISPSGPNPLMVQALPFQPGASFSTPISGTVQSGSGLISGLGSGYVPRRIDIQIRRGPSAPQAEPTESQLSAGQRPSSTNVSGEAPINQPTTRASDAPGSHNGAPVRILPFRTMMAALPDLNRLPSESAGGSLGLLYPGLGRYPNVASGNLSSRSGNNVSGEHQSSGIRIEPNRNVETASHQHISEDPAGNGGRVPPLDFEQRDPAVTRTIDIDILSNGGIQNDQNSEGQIPSGILQLLRGLFPTGEFHVESESSQATAMGSATEQGRTDSPAADGAEQRPTEEGIFLSRLLQRIMPVITQDTGTDHNDALHEEGDTSQHRDGSSSSTPVEDSEVGTPRRQGEPNPGPYPKRRKTE